MSPDRVVKVTLSANIAEYKSAMEEAARKTRETADAADRLAQQKQAFQALGATGLAVGGMLATGFGIAVKKFADFDQAMSGVSAATHESSANMDLLRDAAIQAGASTVFSATDAANAIEELGKAGMSTADILGGGLQGALDLAAAGGLGVADAAGIAATALTQFGLKGSDMAHVADLLSAGAGKAMGDVSDLSAALNQTGLVASATGLSIEETTAGLAAFASQGMLGSDAGTSFKTMLQRLTPQSAEAAKMMDQLGISAYDAQGQFVGLSAFAGNLQTAMKNLTPEQRNAAMAVMFGADAVRAANVLYSEGTKGIDDWTEAVSDQGYAAETARRMLDNLKGDLEALGGAMDTALIQTGSHANDTLRTMVQAVTGLVDLYNDLPAPVQGAVLAIGGATAAVTLSGGAALLAVPKWLELKETVTKAGMSMGGIGLTAGAAGLALGGLFAIVGELAAEHQRAQAKAQSYADSLAEGTQKITDATRELIAENMNVKQGGFLWIEGSSIADNAKQLGIELDTVRKAIEGNAGALTELDEKTQKAMDSYDFMNTGTYKASSAAQDLRNQVEGETGALGKAAEAARNKADATAEGADTSKTAADAYKVEADAADDLNSQLQELIDRINEANGVNQDAVSSNARYQQALVGISEEVQRQRDEYERTNGTLDGFSLSLDQNTASGSANAAMLSDVAGSAQDAAMKQYEVDRATMGSKDAADKYAATLAEQKQAFIDSAVEAGFNADAVQILADKVFALPSAKQMDILANTGPAIGTIDDFISRYGYLNGTIEYRAVMPDLNGPASGNGRMGTYASGGAVYGPGTSTSDSVPVWLSNGEHVLTAAEVQAAGGHEAIKRFRAEMLSGSYSTSYAPVYSTAQQPSVIVQPSAPQMSLEGLTITGQLEVGGDGLARIIDGRVVAYADRTARAARTSARKSTL